MIIMECNKEEAIRAKGIAEKKMQSNDFQGARKIAMKAKNLFPELENISQLLAVCDVHCSAQSNISGSEKDWYGILQVERVADESTIRKQYRKLALVLHPDKNKFPGAEAAFKLIGEANMVLSDKGKRSLYDIKSSASVRTAISNPPTHQANRNPVVRNSYGVHNKFPNVSTGQFSSSNHNQPTQQDMQGRKAFWTCCPFCNIKYQYYNNFVNRALRCQSCSKPFIAYDLGAQGAPPGSNRANLGPQGVAPGSSSGAAFPQQEQVSSQSFKMGAHGTGEFTFSHLNSKANSGQTLSSEQVKRTGGSTEIGGLKSKVNKDVHANTDNTNGGVGISKVNTAKARESGTSGDKNRKRRKLVVDSSESCDTSSSSNNEEVACDDVGGNPAARQASRPDAVYCHRKSSRQRANISYNENISDDDDFRSPPKRPRESKSPNGKEEQKVPFGDEKLNVGKVDDFPSAVEVDKKKIKLQESAPTEASSLCRNGEVGKHPVNVGEFVSADPSSKKSSARDDTVSNTDMDSTSEPEFYDCLDPEFSDFDKDKDEKCFAVDQIWACYDTIDGMPRFYAKVRKVFSPGFKLRFTWLEANPEEQGAIDWVNEGLPVGCGKFMHGDTEETKDRLTFSHQIHFEKGSNRGSYLIYPRKGETWALFKDWDIRWSSDPENHKKYIFEIVEILSDFGHDTGIEVGYLVRIKGFVSLFQRTNQGGFLIPSSEILQFSHRIPSFRMTGAEGERVPEGSFELDPASLPTNPNEVWQPEEVRTETESKSANVNDSKSSVEKVQSKINSENTSTPKKCDSFDGKNFFERETVKLRRSPRESNSTCKKPGKADEKIHATTEKRFVDLTESPRRPSCFADARVSEEAFNDFNRDKSEVKFQLGQIWALYSSKGGMPNNYAQIKKIELSPLKLHVALLEPCTVRQPISSGMFKVQYGKLKIFSPSSLSHVVKVESIGKNKFEIYPREGEIWAIYKDWNSDLSWPDLENCEYVIVEVLKNNEACIEVQCLVHLTGFKSVFKAKRRQRSNAGILEVPRGELSRFSHQIPAFQLTGEKDGFLRGCWELDPASIPGSTLGVN